ncbi:MAG: TPM domain-containing protein, partial [Spirochaetales bacterium]
MIKKILIFLYCFCILPVFSLSIPALVTPVTDEAGIMTNSEKDALNQYLIQLNETTGIQMAVLTIPSLEGQAIESY